MSSSEGDAPGPRADGGAPDPPTPGGAVPGPPPAGGGGPRRWRRRGLALNVVLLALLIAAIVRWVDLRGVWDGLSSLRPVFVLAAVAAALASRFVMGYKWRQLILAAGGRIPLSATISAYFQSVFSGRLMPIGIGGEVLRGWLIARRGVPWGILGGSMAAEKVIAFTSTAILAGIGLLYIVARLPVGAKTPFAAAILAGLGLGALVLALMLHAPAHERGAALLRHRVPPRIGRTLRTVSDALLGYRSRPAVLATNMLMAALEQSLQILKLYVIGRGVGIEIPVLPFAAALMVLLFVRRIAGYVEGWGLAEGASILTLTVLGVTAELAVSLAVANYAVTTMAALPGAYLLWRSGIGWRGDPPVNAAPPARREPPSGKPLDPRSQFSAPPVSQR